MSIKHHFHGCQKRRWYVLRLLSGAISSTWLYLFFTFLADSFANYIKQQQQALLNINVKICCCSQIVPNLLVLKLSRLNDAYISQHHVAGSSESRAQSTLVCIRLCYRCVNGHHPWVLGINTAKYCPIPILPNTGKYCPIPQYRYHSNPNFSNVIHMHFTQ